MPLILFMKSCTLGRVAGRIAAIFAGATSLAGCISSTTPILGDAKAILGERIEMHMGVRLDACQRGYVLRPHRVGQPLHQMIWPPDGIESIRLGTLRELECVGGGRSEPARNSEGYTHFLVT